MSSNWVHNLLRTDELADEDDANNKTDYYCCDAVQQGFKLKTGATNCTKKWKKSGGVNRVPAHLEKEHGLTKSVYEAKTAAKATTLSVATGASARVLSQMGIQESFERARANAQDYGTKANDIAKVLYHFCFCPFTDIEAPHFRKLPSLKLPEGLKTRENIRALLPNAAFEVLDHHLSRFAGRSAALCGDGGTRFSGHYLAFNLLIPDVEPIFLCIVDIETTTKKTLDSAELRRLLFYFAGLLKEKYSINVVQFVADNAAYMHANNNHPDIPDDEDLQLLEQTEAIGRSNNPFVPVPSDGLKFYNPDWCLERSRCTLHSLQLFVESFCEKSKVMIDGIAAADAVVAVVKNFKKEHANWKQIHATLDEPNKGCPTRWFAKLEYMRQALYQAQLLGCDRQTVYYPLINATAELAVFKAHSDRMEHYQSGAYDALVTFHCLDTEANRKDAGEIAKMWNERDGSRVARKSLFITTQFILVCWFHPAFLWNKPVEIVGVGGDWVTEKLEAMYGAAVAVEHEDFRLWLSTFSPTLRKTLVEQFTEKEYLTWWFEHCEKRFPLLRQAVSDLLRMNHTEVECERTFSVLVSLISKFRTNMSPRMANACMTMRQNWTIKDLPTRVTDEKISGSFCLNFLQRFLTPQLEAEIEEEKKNNPFMFADNRARRTGGASDENAVIAALQEDAATSTRGRAARLNARKLAQDQYLKSGGAILNKHTNADSLLCGTCEKFPLLHEDKHGVADCYDWFIICSGCKKTIHSDCSGVDPVMRSRVESSEFWFCKKCSGPGASAEEKLAFMAAKKKRVDDRTNASAKRAEEKRENLRRLMNQ